MAVTSTYSSQLVAITVNGNLITGSGFADGDFVKISRDVDSYSKVVGADGYISRALSANRGGSIEITLQSTSPSNDVLSAMAAQDELTQTGIGSVQVKDVSGRTICSAQNAWVKKLPEVTFGTEVGTRVWALDCDHLIMSVGGN